MPDSVVMPTADLTVGHLFPITVLVLLALVVPLAPMTLSWVLNKHTTRNVHQDLPYECGIRSTYGTAEDRFSSNFTLIAMLFFGF